MDTAQIDALIAAIEAERPRLADIVEGLQDFQRLLADAAFERPRRIVAEVLATTSRRAELMDGAVAQLAAAKFAVKILEDHGFPTVDIIRIPPEVYAVFENQRHTIEAALSRFTPDTVSAVAGTITFSEPENIP